MKVCKQCGMKYPDSVTQCQRCGAVDLDYVPTPQRNMQQGQPRPQGQNMQGRPVQPRPQGQNMQGQNMQGQNMQGQNMQGQNMQGRPVQPRPQGPNQNNGFNGPRPNQNGYTQGQQMQNGYGVNQPQTNDYQNQFMNEFDNTQNEQEKQAKKLWGKNKDVTPNQPVQNNMQQNQFGMMTDMQNGDVITVKEWVMFFLQMLVPIWNIIVIIRILKNPNENKSKQNYVKAYLIWLAVSVVLGIILSAVMSAALGSLLIGSSVYY